MQCSCPKPLIIYTANLEKNSWLQSSPSLEASLNCKGNLLLPTRHPSTCFSPLPLPNSASCSQGETSGLAPRRFASSSWSSSFLLHSSFRCPQTAHFILLSLTSKSTLNVTTDLPKSGKTAKQLSCSQRDPSRSSK